ncbi:hypothetical protein HDV00_004982 [Rhizophlyctis rosea]|nr:hypothetical protein HDV00_004982 [Rhizophlyctis rosea]
MPHLFSTQNVSISSPPSRKTHPPLSDPEPAMIHLAKRIRCCVLVDDNRLEEYNIQVDGSVVTCYVAVEAGKPYQVQICNEGHVCTDDNALIARLYLDGIAKPFDGMVLRFGTPDVFKGRWISAGRIQRYVFKQLDVRPAVEDDNPDSMSQNGDASELSSIVVTIWRAKTRQEPTAGRPVLRKQTGVDERVATKSDRILDSATRLEPPKADDASGYTVVTQWRGECLDQQPYVKFIFKYGSRGALEAQDIIPRPAPRAHNHNITSTSRGTVVSIANLQTKLQQAHILLTRTWPTFSAVDRAMLLSILSAPVKDDEEEFAYETKKESSSPKRSVKKQDELPLDRKYLVHVKPELRAPNREDRAELSSSNNPSRTVSSIKGKERQRGAMSGRSIRVPVTTNNDRPPPPSATIKPQRKIRASNVVQITGPVSKSESECEVDDMPMAGQSRRVEAGVAGGNSNVLANSRPSTSTSTSTHPTAEEDDERWTCPCIWEDGMPQSRAEDKRMVEEARRRSVVKRADRHSVSDREGMDVDSDDYDFDDESIGGGNRKVMPERECVARRSAETRGEYDDLDLYDSYESASEWCGSGEGSDVDSSEEEEEEEERGEKKRKRSDRSGGTEGWDLDWDDDVPIELGSSFSDEEYDEAETRKGKRVRKKVKKEKKKEKRKRKGMSGQVEKKKKKGRAS